MSLIAVPATVSRPRSHGHGESSGRLSRCSMETMNPLEPVDMIPIRLQIRCPAGELPASLYADVLYMPRRISRPVVLPACSRLLRSVPAPLETMRTKAKAVGLGTLWARMPPERLCDGRKRRSSRCRPACAPRSHRRGRWFESHHLHLVRCLGTSCTDVLGHRSRFCLALVCACGELAVQHEYEKPVVR